MRGVRRLEHILNDNDGFFDDDYDDYEYQKKLKRDNEIMKRWHEEE